MHDFNLDFNLFSSIKELENHFLLFMNKSLIIAALFLCACFTQFANAQEDEAIRGIRVKSLPSIPLIIRGGLNLSDLSLSGSDVELSRRTSFNVGVLFDTPIGFNDKLSLQSGLLLTNKGFEKDGYENSKSAKWTCSAMYLEVPVLLVCHFPLNENAQCLVNAGPYFAYGIDGDITYGSTPSWENYSSTQKTKTFAGDGYGFNRFDFGISFGTGLAYKRIYFGIQADLGLVDVKSPKYDTLHGTAGITAKNRTISLNVSYKL